MSDKNKEQTDPFLALYSRFMIGKLVKLFSLKIDDILINRRVKPIKDKESKTYYFTDGNNTNYAVMAILGKNGQPIDYKALRIVRVQN